MTTATPATTVLSLEERLAKARLVRAQNRANVPAVAKKFAPFSPSRDDSEHWMALARQRGLQLPYASTKCTTAGMTHWLRRLGLSVAWFYEYTGFTSLRQWIDHNPTWTLRSLVGLLLEEA